MKKYRKRAGTMTKAELFKKYNISEGYSQWDPTIDNWFSVEIYRRMHDGELPPQDGSDKSSKYILDFIDKTKDPKYFFSLENPGSHYTTAHRMVYRYADQILAELNAAPSPNTGAGDTLLKGEKDE